MERSKPVLVAQGETIKSVHKSNDLLWGHNSANWSSKRDIYVCVCGPNETHSNLVILLL